MLIWSVPSYLVLIPKVNQQINSDIDSALIFKNLDDSERGGIQVQLMLSAAQIDSRIEPHPISPVDFNSYL